MEGLYFDLGAGIQVFFEYGISILGQGHESLRTQIQILDVFLMVGVGECVMLLVHFLSLELFVELTIPSYCSH